ncbi:L-type lectin-domain containing receptor kinase IX.1-like [Dorcoceras hygrometricum]|uniref:non-specific serine/threonine protein kinase n=1 Tax=Dorcoceras hygrometricum TaxID=472368 RepID=A0A2Z7BXR6_9LAMI|nr:L-type lectin-domain containing receptor kinase IX.1-like [Dorcoceras hygrometricum]
MDTLYTVIAYISILRIPFSHSSSFSVSNFTSDIANVVSLEGDAVISGTEILLNDYAYLCRVGRVIYNGKVPLWDSSSQKPADFTTHFSFTIDTMNASKYGHGIVFFLAPVGSRIPPNSDGGYLGIYNTTTTDVPQTQIVSVEFDSYSNGWDPGYEHVGINTNSITSSATKPWNVSLHSGRPADAWIVYNATAKNMSVFWSYGNGPNSSLSYAINLQEILPQWVMVGISASTGMYVEKQTLGSWEFSSSLDIQESNRQSKDSIGLIVGLSVASGGILIVGGVIAFFVFRKWRDQRDERSKDAPEAANLTSINDLERGAWPKRFSYGDLSLATNNFSDDRKLGEGGFGCVYRGHLNDIDFPIAVKRISRKSKQGKKQYMTEVKVISMLRHKNLVKLLGWCHERNEFLLVYEFLSNGSLDYHLFGKKNPLFWAIRYKITRGLASALLYLHEEGEQCVLHRDVKSSNVMLDDSFNVKLGDFGLARLMDRELSREFTGLAGTLGYMAPEYVSKGRASKESDVYSFGVVALEIATGRKSGDHPLNKESQRGLVEWVWDLYATGSILAGVDEKLETYFDPKQVECVMIVGLWCAHPDHKERPSIREASRVLSFEASLPKLPKAMPVAVYCAPVAPSVGSGEPFLTGTSIDVGR